MKKRFRPEHRRVIWRDGDMEVALTTYPPLARMPAHQHDALGVSVVLSGAVEESVGQQTRQAAVGAGVVKPAGTRHANRFGPDGARLLGIGLRGTPAALWTQTGALARWTWFRETATLGAALRLAGTAGPGLAPPAELAEAMLLRMADVSAPACRTSGGAPPRWLARVRDQLHADPARVCRISLLAQEVGVHPVYLARSFRRYYGRTVTDYLHQLRVLAAAERLAAGDGAVAAIAADAGFADHSHLCRIFRRTLGVSPTAFRLVARG
jgi:AraC family transcriptional regulator